MDEDGRSWLDFHVKTNKQTNQKKKCGAKGSWKKWKENRVDWLK
jgi:hypothetical protein